MAVQHVEIGTVVDKTINTYQSRFREYVPYYILFNSLMGILLIAAVITVIFSLLSLFNPQQASFSVIGFVISFIFAVIAIGLNYWLNGAAQYSILFNRPLKESLEKTRSKIVSLTLLALIVNIVNAIVISIAFIASLVVYVLFIIAIAAIIENSGVAILLLLLGLQVLPLLGVGAAAILLAPLNIFPTPVYLYENVGILTAIKKSWALGQNIRIKLFLLIIVMTLIFAVASQLVTAGAIFIATPIVVIGFSLMPQWGISSLIISVILAVLIVMTLAGVIMPLKQIWPAIAYIERKKPIREEIKEKKSLYTEPLLSKKKPIYVEEEPQKPELTIYCRYCGTKIPHDSVFCPNCGTKLK